ncbi:hypothetical protein GQ44DRAFT_631213 [Phaeosphaeriaceae sp. PMI808]|nr:hypothetical protein GQ44DRAFT_631213 [Phaeosphaeriaceae sp. PMI808]
MANNSSLCVTGVTPITLANNFICNPGFYCPNNSVINPPQYCAPTKECQGVRLQAVENTCDSPQGKYEPIVCTKGYYCPSPGSNKYPCPEKHYCPPGTETPFKCGRVSICLSGSSRQFNLEGFVVALILDILLMVFIFAPGKLGFFQIKGKNHYKDDHFSDEDCVPVGDTPIFLPTDRYNNEPKHAGICVSYTGVSFEINQPSRFLISSVTGNLQKGTLCGILGPSGAGKTTLMKLLMGKLKPTEGTVEVNGVQTKLSRYRKLIGYVPSNDILSPHLTVRENILYSCRLRGPRTWSEKQRHIFTEKVMQSLGILHVEYQLVGDSLTSSISTGQRKRVRLAMELITAPTMLFLDEPTSGLDSTTATSLMGLLKNISETGVTIVCIIHQPREKIFHTLDNVILLAEGRQLYQGSPGDAAIYFSSLGYQMVKGSNPADFLLDIAAGKETSANSHILNADTVQNLSLRWDQQQREILTDASNTLAIDLSSESQSTYIKRATAIRGALWLRQVQHCYVRAMKEQFRQPDSLILEIAVGGVAGLLIGLGLYPNKGIHFQGTYLPPFEMLSSAVDYTTVPKIGEMIALAIALAAAAPGVSTFGEQKPLYWQETAAGHSRSAYFIGKTFATLPRMSLSALHFTSSYAILATPTIHFWILYVLNLLYFFCVYGLASMISVAVRRENGTLLAMILCLIIGAFGGYAPMLSTIQSWHLEWLWRMCPGTWLTEAYLDQTLRKAAYLYDVHAAATWTGFHLRRLALDMIMIFLIGSFYRCVTFIGLIIFDRNKQR